MIIQAAERLNQVQEYYFSKKLNEIRLLNAQGKDIINLGIGSPDLPPSAETIEALITTAQADNTHGYQSYTGIPEFREAISKWLKKTYQITIDAEGEILPLMGSKEGVMHISMAFLNKGDKILVPNPGYPTYSSVSNLLEADIENYDLDENNDWNIDLEKLKKIDLSAVKLMWINYPNMPTGASPNVKVLEELIALAKQNQFLIVNDNPYSLILTKGVPFSIFQIKGADEVCLELNSLSKSHNMAGWRVGWLAGKSDYISTVIKVKSNMDSGMFLGLQKASIKAFDNSSKWYDNQNDIYTERKLLINQIFELLNVKSNPKNSGLFVWGKVSEEITDVKSFVDRILYESGVFITPGFIFGSNGNRYIRASLCAKKETIQKALDRIKSLKVA